MSAKPVKRAFPADVARLAPLFDRYRQFYGQPADPGGAAKFLYARLERDQSVVYFTEENGVMTGFVQLYPVFSSVSMGAKLILNDLYVMPAARGKGVASTLLQAAVDHARTQGAIGLELATAPDNAPAQQLYERHGWTRNDKFYRYDLAI